MKKTLVSVAAILGILGNSFGMNKAGNIRKGIKQDTAQDCNSPTSIIIPSSVTSIGDYAFDNCWKLTSIVIPSSVTTIGAHPFLNC